MKEGGHTSLPGAHSVVHAVTGNIFSRKLKGAKTDMDNLRGIGYLQTKLAQKRPRVLLRYEYYEMKNAVKDFQISVPPEFAFLKETLGWCGKAADSLADRLVFREFTDDNFAINEIYEMNSKDVLFDSAVLSASISSCCFIYISADETGYPRLQVIDGGNATGIIDPITMMLKEGYAVLQRDDNGSAIKEAYFTPGNTKIIEKGKQPYDIENMAPYPLLVPVILRPDAVRPFGHSRISRACMSIMQQALRTLRRVEVSAEFYSFPQKYVTGLSQDAERMDKWKATYSSFMQFDKDEDGTIPQVGQFTQQSMSPYVDQIRMLAGLFSGETGLTLDDLGFPSDNPSSAEAIKATHETLRLTARKAQRTFGVGFLNAGYLAACIRDDYGYQRQQVYLTRPKWEPVFEPDAAMLSSIGDGAIKINQAIEGYFGKSNLRDLTGIEAEE